MRKRVFAGLLALPLMAAGCGSNSTTAAATSASGNWAADIVGGAGEAGAISFITSFTVGSNGALSITSLAFINTQTCFVSGATASGTLNITSGTNSVVTGTLSFTVQSGSPAGNTLTLTGTENGNTITGTWTLTGGTGCTGGGTFTMTKS